MLEEVLAAGAFAALAEGFVVLCSALLPEFVLHAEIKKTVQKM
jgi:hypothetical protein